MSKLFLLLCIMIMNNGIYANNDKPFVIPEIKHWESYSGDFTITNKTRIVCNKNNNELFEVAQLLSSDYEKMFRIKLKVEDKISKGGVISLNIVNNKNYGNECYCIDIHEN